LSSFSGLVKFCLWGRCRRRWRFIGLDNNHCARSECDLPGNGGYNVPDLHISFKADYFRVIAIVRYTDIKVNDRAACCSNGGRRVDLEFCFTHNRAHLAVKQIEDRFPLFTLGVDKLLYHQLRVVGQCEHAVVNEEQFGPACGSGNRITGQDAVFNLGSNMGFASLDGSNAA